MRLSFSLLTKVYNLLYQICFPAPPPYSTAFSRSRPSPCCISSSSVPADSRKPLSFFPASPQSKDVRYSRAPSLRQGYAVLAIPATADSSATLSPVSALRLSTYNAYPCSCRFLQGRGGFPQLIAHLSIRVAAATPPPSFLLLASLVIRMLPSPKLKGLGQWNSSFTRLHLRSR